MRHKVYAFIDKQPYGLVDYFSSRVDAKKCAHYVEKTGVNVNGILIPAKTKIVVTS